MVERKLQLLGASGPPSIGDAQKRVQSHKHHLHALECREAEEVRERAASKLPTLMH